MNFLTKDIRLNPTHQQKNAECLPVLAQNLASHLASERSLAPTTTLAESRLDVWFISFFPCIHLCCKNKKLAFSSQALAVFFQTN